MVAPEGHIYIAKRYTIFNKRNKWRRKDGDNYQTSFVSLCRWNCSNGGNQRESHKWNGNTRKIREN